VFSTTKVPFYDDAKRVVGVVGIARDVETARREAQAIRAERDMFATMAAVVPGAFASYRIRPDGRLTPYATASIVDLFGATPAELLRDPSIPLRHTHPDDRHRRGSAERSARDLKPFRCEFGCDTQRKAKSGSRRCRARSAIDGSTLWHGFVLDATERKRFERELAEERDRLAGIAESSPGALCAFRRDADGSVSFPYASSALADLYGVPLEAMRRDATSALSLIHPDDAARGTLSSLPPR
jgi:PAS domain-containing protein